jgi:rubrerythrin
VPRIHPTVTGRLLRPLHRWVWLDPHRCARKLLRFAQTEADGGRDLTRAAELTSDPVLRRLFLKHAGDEHHHASLFRARGRALLQRLPRGAAAFEANWLSPGERGLDDLRVDRENPEALLAFLHLSERAAAQRFAVYREVLTHDPATAEVFDRVLDDEEFHMRYTGSQLARVATTRTGWRLWQGRLGRLWKAYLRLAAALAGVFGTLVLALQYFLVLAPFALWARRSAARERPGFAPARAPSSLGSQY